MTHFDSDYYMSCHKENCKYMFTNKCDKCIYNASIKEDNYEPILNLDVKLNKIKDKK